MLSLPPSLSLPFSLFLSVLNDVFINSLEMSYSHTPKIYAYLMDIKREPTNKWEMENQVNISHFQMKTSFLAMGYI